ncbi:hypothetical protein M407DRAFT_33650 [Tulasnella calospora MUT 4182]|uniref:Uncharacterized protein n=1 Tax=Tulasnella calospora MUT 4182 TaxID=1051891 RepID=A0A0C3Q1Y2_9AGAM|nr:hypothetical protein M407DRAFT_33650 [Tulasnella calospora MUT 4182]
MSASTLALKAVILTHGNWIAWDRYLQAHCGVLGAQGQAKGAILESVNEANTSLIDGQDAATAYATLKKQHNVQDSTHQYSLFQNFALIAQKPKESLTEYLGRQETALKKFKDSLPTSTSVDDALNMLMIFNSITNLEQDEQNEAFIQALTIAGGFTRTTIASTFATEQTRWETMATVKEAGLNARQHARLASAPSCSPRAPAPGSPVCSHCGKAHQSNNCWRQFPHLKPQHIKDRDAAQETRRKAAGSSTSNVKRSNLGADRWGDLVDKDQVSPSTPSYIPLHDKGR